MREKEKSQSSLSIMKRWNWSLEDTGCGEWPALPPEGVRGLGLWLHSGRGGCPWLVSQLENIGMSLVGTVAGSHVDVQGLCRTVPAPHLLWRSGELASSLTCYSTPGEWALCLTQTAQWS